MSDSTPFQQTWPNLRNQLSPPNTLHQLSRDKQDDGPIVQCNSDILGWMGMLAGGTVVGTTVLAVATSCMSGIEMKIIQCIGEIAVVTCT